MKIDKNVKFLDKKILLRGGAICGLALAFAGGTYYSYHQSSSVRADQDAVVLTDEQVSEKIEQVKTQAINGNILVSIFDRLNNAVKDGSKLSQSELDGYTYYMLVYRDSNQTFYGTDAISSPDAGFKLLLTLYTQSGVDSSFEYTADGESIVLKRDIHKPSSLDEMVSQIESDISDKLDSTEGVDLSNGADLGVDVESKDLVE